MPSSQSDVQIVNMALTRIGSTQIITSFSDSSNEAAQATVWYAQTRDALLRDFPWPWASKYAALVQVSEAGVRANQEWAYSYRYPTDCLAITRLLYTLTTATDPPQTTIPPLTVAGTYARQDSDPYPIPFEVGLDEDGRLIYTDCYQASIKYTMAIEDPTVFSPDFASLLAWRLAVEFAYGLAVSDGRRQMAQKMYESELEKTRATALNQAQRDNPYTDWNSEFIRARQGG